MKSITAILLFFSMCLFGLSLGCIILAYRKMKYADKSELMGILRTLFLCYYIVALYAVIEVIILLITK
ncbi:MAG: hypothetical protein LBG17_00185 [Bacteroidales bacterium]|jgi:hypothetical protein|nr:hypothetical protein [Bacteroidales bacterium]